MTMDQALATATETEGVPPALPPLDWTLRDTIEQCALYMHFDNRTAIVSGETLDRLCRAVIELDRKVKELESGSIANGV